MAGLTRPSTFFRVAKAKMWMPGTMGLCSGRRSRTRVPGMTAEAETTSALKIKGSNKPANYGVMEKGLVAEQA
jgi:hypothetical protein